MGSAGGVLTDLTNAIVKSRATVLQGTVVTRPYLQTGDGKNQIYVCDVNCTPGLVSPGYNQDQLQLLGIPGTKGFTVNDTLTTGTILRSVPVAANNGNLRYADVGNAVVLHRTANGQWQVTGFGTEMPGTRIRYAVNLNSGTIGPVVDLSVSSRLLTLGELSTAGPGFGYTPLGATGLFIAGVLQEISS
jgi:hypothetical protein